MNKHTLRPEAFFAEAASSLPAVDETPVALPARTTHLDPLLAENDDALGEALTEEREVDGANRAKDQFLAILSHELRTPLSSILLQSQMLLRGNLDGARVKQIAEAIERGAKRQARLVDDLLDMFSIVAGKLQIQRQTVNLCAVVRAAIELARAPAEKKSLKIEVALDESAGLVSGDPARLQQIVSNLLSNAIKFTPEGGTVAVVLETAGAFVRLQVRDTGIGIDAAFLPHLFNQFTQKDSSSTRTHGGLGLGLAIVSHLVEAHGGTIQASSAGPGKGATFSITLPVAPDQAD